MKFTLKELFEIPVRQLLLSSTKYKAQLYVDLDLRTNGVKYLLMTEDGVQEFKYLQGAAFAFKEHQNTQNRIFTAAPHPINKFTFSQAIYEHNVGDRF